jgi:hypothetical protein
MLTVAADAVPDGSAMFKLSAKAPGEVAIPLPPRAGMAIDLAVLLHALFAWDATSP